MKRFYGSLSLGILGAVSVLLLSASQVRAVITVNGSLDVVDYGSALTVNTNPTAFGDSSYTGTPVGPDANGSELDAGYGVIQGGNLYLFLSGNAENNGNHWNVFIAGGAAGQSILAAPTGNTMGPAMNGSVFSPGFLATFAVDVNDFHGTNYVEEYTLTGVPSGGFVGSIPLSAGIGTGQPGVTTIGLNNSNTGGVTGSTGSSAASLAVTTGLELAIPLSAIGWTGGSILVLADINGGGDGFLSNQFLPGLPSGTGNVGGGGPYSGTGSGKFNFGSTPGEYFTVVPEPSTIGLVVVGLLGVLGIRRRKV